ncbi:MAG: triose-phosphate isomerase [Bacillota bacterium]
MKIFIANWKMQVPFAEAEILAKSFARAFKEYKGKAVICPDFLALPLVGKTLIPSALKLGVQDLAPYSRGAYTGEVSPVDMAVLGAEFALIGHSERRSIFHEDDKLIAEKIRSAVEQGMTPVLCVGENAAERKLGRAASVVRNQLKGAFKGMKAKELKSLVIAYEPVWAIGTGSVCDPATAFRMKATISDFCLRSGLKKTPVLYGGSVKPDNAASFLAKGGFDGLLVGGASLEVESFLKICKQ